MYAYDLFPNDDPTNATNSREGRIHPSQQQSSRGISNSSSSSSKKNEELIRFHYPDGKYQLIHEWNFSTQAQTVTAMTCMNSVQSSLILCSTSDK